MSKNTPDDIFESENCPTLDESVYTTDSNGNLIRLEVTDDASND